MKHFINVFVLLVLIGFILGATFLSINYNEKWGLAYLPLSLLFIGWLIKLSDNYSKF